MSKNKHAKKILLVEDEAIISIVVSKTMKSFGYNIEPVNSGEKAVDYVAANKEADLVLMDIDLGEGIDGTEAARRILKMRNIPIVFHTAHSEQEMVSKVKGITRYGYVIKNTGNFVLNSSIEMAFELFEANKKVEESMAGMRESEEKYRAAFMTSPDAVNINAMDGRYVDINDGFTKLTGYTRDDVIGVLSSDIKIWSRPEDRVKLLDGLTTTGSVENLESLFLCKDGSFKTALMSARIIKIKNVPHILSVTRDISHRKIYEEEIKKSNEELGSLNEELMATIEELEATNEEFEAINEELITANQELQSKESIIKNEQLLTNSLLDSLPGIFYLYSYPELRLERWNKNHEKILGFAPGEINGRGILEWFSPAGVETMLSGVDSLMKKGSGMIEFPILARDGTEIPFLLTGVKFEANDRTYLMGTGFDITQRKKIENALSESEERYRTLAGILPDGVVIHLDGKIVYANEAAHKIVHAAYLDQMIGLPVSGFVHPEYADLVTKRISDGINSHITGEPVEEVFIALDGAEITVRVTAIPFTYSGNPAMLIVFNDISASKKDEDEIKKLLTEKELLLREVHHRIKNNMNTIRGLLLLQSYTLSEPLAVNALLDAEHRVQSMMVLYDKLYRSDDFNELPLKEYLPALVDEIAENFLIHGMIKIEKQIDDFKIDTKNLFPLGIIVNELITNAMKYAFTGRMSGLITVSASRNNNNAIIIISDNGNGLSGSFDIGNSTGFGLQLVNMLTEQMGGSIRMERGKGTKFILEFGL